MSFSLTRPGTARAAMAIVLVYLMLSPSAYAFKQGIHQNITETKLQSDGFSNKSAETVGDANWYTDIYEQTNTAAHFDDESLAAGSSRLRGKIDSIITNLDNCNKDEALKEMGRALHTLQDFYAHSNWVNHWGGVNAGIYSMANPPASLSCSPPTFGPGGVTTGYFSLFGYLYPSPLITQCASTPSNKCCHKEMNKDEPSRPFHGPARASAEAATAEFADRVETEILSRYPGAKGQSMVKLLKKDQRDIAFVIDDTGSMSTDLAGVKSTVNSLVDSISAGNESPRFSLYTFKDSTTYHGTTCDPIEMKAKVAPLFASGGGDCPEMANSAQLLAASRIQKGGQILVATDASARDPEIAPTLLSLVQAKNINISVILTGNCTSESASFGGPVSESDGPREVESNASVIPAADLTAASSQRSFSALAALSGGLMFRVSRVEFPLAADIILNRTRPENADILYAIDNSTAAGKSYSVPVDSTMEDVTFVVGRLQATGTFTLTLRRPDGSVVAAGDPGVSFTTLSGVRAVKIVDPADGAWTLDVGGTGRFSASVFGKSDLNLTRFSFLDEPSLQRPEVDSQLLAGLPVAGDATLGEARIGGTHGGVSFTVRNGDATVIGPLALPEDPEHANRYRGSVVVPGSDFLVYANGVDANGQSFQRVFRQFFKAQTVRVVPQTLFQTAAPGTTLTYIFDVTNLGATPMTYRLFRNSGSGYAVGGPTSLSLGVGETKPVSLTVSIPTFATVGSEDPLSLVVTSTSDPSVTNNAVVTTLVGTTNFPPDVTGAVASKARLFPPNHQFEEVEIEGVDDPDGDPVTITIDAIQQDEEVGANGSGSTCPDAGGVGTAVAMLRAERSGDGDGRVYQIAFTATDGRGGSTQGSVTVCVPHDNSKDAVCVDSVVRYDSTVCTPE